jgi:hypothetical protein
MSGRLPRRWEICIYRMSSYSFSPARRNNLPLPKGGQGPLQKLQGKTQWLLLPRRWHIIWAQCSVSHCFTVFRLSRVYRSDTSNYF